MGTTKGDPDIDFLEQAIGAVRNLLSAANLRAFQTAMGDGPTGKFQWYDLVPGDMRDGIPEQEVRCQV